MVCIGGKASSGVTIGGATGGSTVCGTVTGDSVLWASRPGGMLADANLKFAGVPVTFQDINGYSAFVLFLGVSSLAFGSSDVSLFKRDSLGKTCGEIVNKRNRYASKGYSYVKHCFLSLCKKGKHLLL